MITSLNYLYPPTMEQHGDVRITMLLKIPPQFATVWDSIWLALVWFNPGILAGCEQRARLWEIV